MCYSNIKIKNTLDFHLAIKNSNTNVIYNTIFIKCCENIKKPI
jgi:hypothetical protein